MTTCVLDRAQGRVLGQLDVMESKLDSISNLLREQFSRLEQNMSQNHLGMIHLMVGLQQDDIPHFIMMIPDQSTMKQTKGIFSKGRWGECST